jgi:hypothetical protein
MLSTVVFKVLMDVMNRQVGFSESCFQANHGCFEVIDVVDRV